MTAMTKGEREDPHLAILARLDARARTGNEFAAERAILIRADRDKPPLTASETAMLAKAAHLRPRGYTDHEWLRALEDARHLNVWERGEPAP